MPEEFQGWLRRIGSREGRARQTFSFEDRQVPIVSLPADAVVRRVWLEIIEPFDAEINDLMVGVYGEEDRFIDPSDILNEGAAGAYPTNSAGPFARLAADTTIIATYTPTGTPTAGLAEVFIEYILP